MRTTTKCPYCNHHVQPALDGTCPKCTRQLIETGSAPDQEIQFYCRECNEFFFSRRDENGIEQALCPTCGDWCFTPEFEAGEIQRSDAESAIGMGIVLKLIFILAASGIGWAILKSL